MNANQLRASILQMAIEGKLVPQLDSEEPAIHILERICKKRKIKLTPINNSLNDHDLPKGWTKCLIGELLELKAGKFIKGSSIACNPSKENSFPCYGGNGIRGFVENFNRDGLYPIIGRQGALCGNLKLANGKFYATEHAVVVDCFDEVDAKWCFYTLTQLNLNKYATATAQPGLAVKTINGLQITVPPLEEQKRIVAKLEQLLPLVDEYGTAYEKLEELNAEFPDKLKASVLQSAIEGKIVPQLDSEPVASEYLKGLNPKVKFVDESETNYSIPDKWRIVKLCSICTKIVDGDHNPPKGELEPTKYLMLSAKNINNNSLIINDAVRFLSKENFETSHSRTQLAKDDVLLTIVGTLGRSCVVEDVSENITFQRSVACLSTLIYSKYLKYFLDAPDVQKYITINAKGTAQKGFYLNQLKNLHIAIPPLEEQKRIVAKVEELFALIDAMKK